MGFGARVGRLRGAGVSLGGGIGCRGIRNETVEMLVVLTALKAAKNRWGMVGTTETLRDGGSWLRF